MKFLADDIGLKIENQLIQKFRSGASQGPHDTGKSCLYSWDMWPKVCKNDLLNPAQKNP